MRHREMFAEQEMRESAAANATVRPLDMQNKAIVGGGPETSSAGAIYEATEPGTEPEKIVDAPPEAPTFVELEAAAVADQGGNSVRTATISCNAPGAER